MYNNVNVLIPLNCALENDDKFCVCIVSYTHTHTHTHTHTLSSALLLSASSHQEAPRLFLVSGTMDILMFFLEP